MKAVFSPRVASISACCCMLTFASASMAQSTANCVEIANDVSVAVGKDPAKVLMVVEDALVINEGCAADIVRSAILASKADATLANQIVQTAVSVAPKMAGVITDAASDVVPGLALAAVAPAEEVVRPLTAEGKNPGKNPIVPPAPVAQEEDFFVPSTIRGVFLIQPPASGPLPPRCNNCPVSPSTATP